MKAISTYLESLQNKVFKLLPMREDYDNGADNHVYDYLDNLIVDCSGAMSQFIELQSNKRYIEVYNGLFYMQDESISLLKWRAVVLRSTRIIHELYEQQKSEVGDCG